MERLKAGVASAHNPGVATRAYTQPKLVVASARGLPAVDGHGKRRVHHVPGFRRRCENAAPPTDRRNLCGGYPVNTDHILVTRRVQTCTCQCHAILVHPVQPGCRCLVGRTIALSVWLLPCPLWVLRGKLSLAARPRSELPNAEARGGGARGARRLGAPPNTRVTARGGGARERPEVDTGAPPNTRGTIASPRRQSRRDHRGET